MNWFRGDQPENSSDGQESNPSSTPDANELRRRRLAKLEEAQAAEKARRRELEERKAKWDAEMKTKEHVAPKPTPPPPQPKPEPVAAPKQPIEPKVKKVIPLASVEEMVSTVITKSLGLSLTSEHANADAQYIPTLMEQLRNDSSTTSPQSFLLTEDHADDILLYRINNEKKPLTYLFGCFRTIGQQLSEMRSNRRIAGDEHKPRRDQISQVVSGVERRIMMYTGMLLSGAFMEVDEANSSSFAHAVMEEKVPAGFIKALLLRHTEEGGPGLEDILPLFSSVLITIRSKAVTDMKLSSRNFLKPLKALSALLAHKELCKLLVSHESFVPKLSNSNVQADIIEFSNKSYLFPFFTISALPGSPLNRPQRFPEDPELGRSMFPNPSSMSRTEAEGALYSLRSSLSIARAYLHQICLMICKAGPQGKDKMLSWFGTVCNLNGKRTGMSPDPREISRDGFVLNVMHVVLKLCDPIVSGGWKMLQKVDPTYPQSVHRVNYEEETRLAADTNMLKRWWVDQRNVNAQESLARQLQVNEMDFASSDMGESSQGGSAAAVVSTEFSFVTECFWLGLRLVQLGFVSVVTMYDETLLRTLQRLKDIIRDIEATKEAGPLPSDQEMQLSVFKARFDALAVSKLCYDVYLQDKESLTTLVRFVTADAEWLMKKLISNPKRESLLPLPTPVDTVFASLPEHVVENITMVLLTTMRIHPSVIDDNITLLDDMVSFCIAASASPLHVKNPYLRAKLIEFLWTIFPRGGITDDDDGEAAREMPNVAMESLFAGHDLSRRFLPGSLFRLYVDVEHTGSHTQFYDKFSIRFRIGSIIESLWYMADYRKSVRNEARDEERFLRFVNMVLNDANHLLDSALDDLEEIHTLQTLINRGSPEWEALSEEEKTEKKERLQKLEGEAKTFNQLANNNVKLIWLLTGDAVVRRIFLRDEMVSRVAEMLNYLLVRLCGKRCNDLVVAEPEKASWKPRQLLARIMGTYIHFHQDETFTTAVARDGRSYNPALFTRAIRIANRRKLLSNPDLEKLQAVAAAAARALEQENEEEEDLGDIPDEFLDPIMSSLMRNPVRLPTSGNVMDRAVISRILLGDKFDPFNRMLLTEDMLEDDVDLKQRIDSFIRERREQSRRKRAGSLS